ncbi:hypothetical protein SLEP1_g55419 [Rubroshorea leprosula]|uniref:Uncharacterized protein n=1 Tax=Rubroshorea leprosula TaxID=152421 RepID=A0AAV5MFB3_9ROSI|nr:hypothetical protein SLEP1_g55419 [Rubroshorea leprosula]
MTICGEFFAKLSSAIASQLFVFLLCNIIITTLLAKSGRLSTKNLEDNNAEDELYEEVVRNTKNCQLQSSEDARELSIEEIDLEMQGNLVLDLDSDSDLDMDNPNSYQRSKSEKFVRPGVEKGKRKKGSGSRCRRRCALNGMTSGMGKGHEVIFALSEEKKSRRK